MTQSPAPAPESSRASESRVLPDVSPPAVRPKRNVAPSPFLPPLDLLREHRQQMGQESFSAVLERRPALIRRGMVFGGLILGLSLGACALLVIVHQTLRSREAQMAGYEQEAKQLRDNLSRERGAVDAMGASNKQLVERLSNVRSSSALLADLQLRVPEGVQLREVQMLGPAEVRFEGIARDPMGFGRVNALELMLRRSALFQAKGVTLEKGERTLPQQFDIQSAVVTTSPPRPIKVVIPSGVAFDMRATLSPLAPDKLIGVMESLKAEGMVDRLEQLKREGLLK